MIFCVKYKNKILLSKTVFSVISVILIYRIILSNNRLNLFKLEAPPGFEPGIRVLQTRALPLGYSAIFQEKIGAGNGAQTRDLCLGKAALYQLSYSRTFALW